MDRNTRSYASAIALLGSLGLLPAGPAAAIDLPFGFDACPTQTPYSDNPDVGRTSAVLSLIDFGSPNVYGFKVCNTSSFFEGEGGNEYRIRDWELPYDPLAGIVNITSNTSEGWRWSIETIGAANTDTGWDGGAPTWFNPSDPFYDPRYLGLTQVIHFYACDGVGEACYGVRGTHIRPGQAMEGFGFESPFGPTNAPYQASWINFVPRSGDPAFPIGSSPDSPGLNVPEPGGLALFAAALGAFLAGRARRRTTDRA